MDTQGLKQSFNDAFGYTAERVYFSPGRINLIGEHTDYNGGNVFPCAISMGTYGAYANREDDTIRVQSANIPDGGLIEFKTTDIAFDQSVNWDKFVRGVMFELGKLGHTVDHGFDLFVHGDLPDASGLSSSASIELLIGNILNEEFNFGLDQLSLVKNGQAVENDYLGLNTGIMDQFAIGMGKKDHAVLLDTNTLKYEYVPVELEDNVVVIMNTNKRRELVDSKYNERRSECETALARIQAGGEGFSTLGDMTQEDFDKDTYLIDDDTLIRRARHAVIENQRTLRAKKALTAGDLTEFGKLVNASGVSLRYDYEVTGAELDCLVQTALKQPGVLGARMTGAGFGGCAIAIVNQANVASFTKAVGDVYKQEIGYDASFYVANIADGPRVLEG
ncbi:galactokinase [uncultured Secundilactobacillus sp.]|uniref:galactokinase n=1 Tax=uncultured Secundilactobacillus sp. TaxID=2813935 RepID=UPI0025871DBB|nr:galactokinase [uncultured Secundilactobacillus sp.]